MLSEFPINVIVDNALPRALCEIYDKPERLYIRGQLAPKEYVYLTVVGSRRASEYGKEVTKTLIQGLAGYPISIVSGLAIGIDCIAHETALSVGLHTTSFPGSSLEDGMIYPRSSWDLALRILESGGCLLSEYGKDKKTLPWMFHMRNRLMAGISKAVLIIEATEKSGSMITARAGTEYNRDVLTVPGSIFSPGSYGPHSLIRLGAVPITKSEDILEVLGL
jgi:DNA processing protein